MGLNGYAIYFAEYAKGKRGIPSRQLMADAGQIWRSMSEQQQNDYKLRAKAGSYKKATSPKKPRKVPGATKKKMFVDEYMARNPGFNKQDALDMWNVLSQADRNAYIGVTQYGGYW